MSRRRRILIRTTDPLAYEVLAALRIAALAHGSGPGTKQVEAQQSLRESKPWLTTAEAAERLGISDRAVRKRIARGRLPAMSCGGRWLVNHHHVRIAQTLD
ncbi:helix-turn-helix domain-containing protein [Mycobacterium hippophais]|uniref:helix-turn-helix domain-containing protein n=1 Tax=Mycobacterium hippophais TaxID=3016340 RepID=UPI0038CDB379